MKIAAKERKEHKRNAFNWVPQYTNAVGDGGMLLFTNTPKAGTNNFWRVRFVPPGS